MESGSQLKISTVSGNVDPVNGFDSDIVGDAQVGIQFTVNHKVSATFASQSFEATTANLLVSPLVQAAYVALTLNVEVDIIVSVMFGSTPFIKIDAEDSFSV